MLLSNRCSFCSKESVRVDKLEQGTLFEAEWRGDSVVGGCD